MRKQQATGGDIVPFYGGGDAETQISCEQDVDSIFRSVVCEKIELTRMKAGMDMFRRCGQQETELAANRKFWSRSNPMFKSVKNFAHDNSGVTAIEYALIAALIAVVIITAVTTLGTKISTTFTNIASALPAG